MLPNAPYVPTRWKELKFVFMIWRAENILTTTGMLMMTTMAAIPIFRRAAATEGACISGVSRETTAERNLASMVENARKSVSQFNQDRLPLLMIKSWNTIVITPAIPAIG